MWIARNLDELPAPPGRRFAAVGVFDGLHLGHREIIGTLAREARAGGAESVVITFDPHPLRILAPDREPPLLQTFDERVDGIRELGVDGLLALPFGRALARMEAERFVRGILCDRLRVARLYVGFNFTFGRGGRGGPALLERLGPEGGFSVRVFPPVEVDGEAVSSSGVRAALQEGDVARAAALLGRPFHLQGPVVHGDARGRTLGFPTANVELPAGLARPACGVYAVLARLGGARYPGVANLGLRPTVGGRREALEVHLFGYGGDCYGEILRVAFVARIRGERRFEDLAALRAQIAADAEAARAILGALPSIYNPDPLC